MGNLECLAYPDSPRELEKKTPVSVASILSVVKENNDI